MEHRYYDIYGAYSKNNVVGGNSIAMSGGSANNLYGGYSNYGYANNNLIAMSGGSTKNLYGGYTIDSSFGSATGNIVTYKSGIIKGGIYGGYAKISSDNKLAIAGTDLSARYVKENTFQSYLFSLPASIKANDVMLKLTNPLKFETHDTLEFNAQWKLDGLKLNDRITLIDKVSNYLSGKYYILAEYNSGTVRYYYGFNLEVINYELTATLINNNGLK